MAQAIDLSQYGITTSEIHRNLSPAQLYEHGLAHDGSSITSTGAMVSISGAKTGRSPKDKRSVDNPDSGSLGGRGRGVRFFRYQLLQLPRSLARSQLEEQSGQWYARGEEESYSGWVVGDEGAPAD